jgi:hypothetical protein
MNKSIIGIIDSAQDAQSILGDLRRIGFGPSAVSVLYPDQKADRRFIYRHSSKAPEIALVCGGVGSALGAIFGLLASSGSLALRGGGLLIAAGPVLAALSCGAAGAALGCIIGALTGRKIPEIEARRSDGTRATGSILIAVHVEDHDAELITESVLSRGGAREVVAATETPAPAAR